MSEGVKLLYYYREDPTLCVVTDLKKKQFWWNKRLQEGENKWHIVLSLLHCPSIPLFLITILKGGRVKQKQRVSTNDKFNTRLREAHLLSNSRIIVAFLLVATGSSSACGRKHREALEQGPSPTPGSVQWPLSVKIETNLIGYWLDTFYLDHVEGWHVARESLKTDGTSSSQDLLLINVILLTSAHRRS